MMNVATAENQNQTNAELRQRLDEVNQALHREQQARIAAEKMFRDCQAFYHSLAESLPVRVFRKDLEGRFTYVNEKFCQMLGHSREHVLGATDYDFAPPHLAEKFLADDRMVMEKDEVFQCIEEHNPDEAGRKTFLLTAKAPLCDGDGILAGLQGVIMDISDLKRAEEKSVQLHRQLMLASRQAGMAEVATGVLHNVGNVLNSVNVSANLIAERIHRSKVASLEKLAAMLRENEVDWAVFAANDPRGKQLPAYLITLSGHLAQERDELLKELQGLRKNVDHVKEIVAMQQNYAKLAGVCESVKLYELLEDAIQLNAGALTRHRVHIVREYEDVPEILVDRHKVLQIFINLISNAKYACEDSDQAEKRLTVRIRRKNQQMADIEFSDNGLGIAAGNLTRIFSHGFTTRKNGHGFGLHSAATAAVEMGGSIRVHSDGIGHGATFIVELPCRSCGPGGNIRE